MIFMIKCKYYVMSELHAFIVAGGGVDLERSSVVAHHLQDELQQRAIPLTNIHGREYSADSSRVRTPSEQYEEVLDHLHSLEADSRALIICQCMGSIATQKVLESSPDIPQKLGAVSFSPPLPSPSELLHSPTSTRRRQSDNSHMKVMQFREGYFGDFNQQELSWAAIPPAYFEEAEQAHDLAKRMKQEVEMGRMAIIAGEQDWNRASPATLKEWRNNWRKQQQYDTLERTLIIPHSGHSLHTSEEYSDCSDSISQAEACRKVIDLGLSLPPLR